jgi:cobalt-zinc-cadmium efflux system protein
VSRPARLWIVLALNLILVGVLIAVGLAAHSLGVLAEGADYIGDAGGIGVALLAIWLSERPSTAARPHGYPRATAYAALINAGWLLVLTTLVAGGAVDRLVAGAQEVRGLPVLVVSSIAAVVMIFGVVIIGADVDDLDDEGGNLNMRAVLLDTAADAAAAIGVAITGGIILATGGLYWLDPAVALVVSAVVGYHAARLLHRAGAALAGRI